MPGPHGYEHDWEYVGGPGLPSKAAMAEAPHAKGATAKVRATHQAPAQDPGARYQTDSKLRGKVAGLKPKARAALAGARERDDLRSRPDGFKDQDRALPPLYVATGDIHDGTALHDAGLVDGTVKGVYSPTDHNGRKYVLNADGKRAAELVREPAAGRGAEQRVQASSGLGAPLPEGYKRGAERKVKGVLPDGVTVHRSADKTRDGAPVDHVLHNGTLLATVRTTETTSYERGARGDSKVASGVIRRKQYVAELPASVRTELGMDPQAAQVKALNLNDAAYGIWKRVRDRRKG